MHKFKDSTPDWLYHPASIDQLPAVQKELIKLSVITRKDNLVPYTSTFVEVSNLDLINKTCPVLVQELQRLQLHDTLVFIALMSHSKVD